MNPFGLALGTMASAIPAKAYGQMAVGDQKMKIASDTLKKDYAVASSKNAIDAAKLGIDAENAKTNRLKAQGEASKDADAVSQKQYERHANAIDALATELTPAGMLGGKVDNTREKADITTALNHTAASMGKKHFGEMSSA